MWFTRIFAIIIIFSAILFFINEAKQAFSEDNLNKQRYINHCIYECMAARNSELNCNNWCTIK